ncbi:uncharacterized protein FOMMEDRAFT_19284 [Fomitiporia mediterranea MF3/22]|uniref:uncharacterized protein n=1 Tax=Fomitiporia mediterranea (strain MF3/22) TaxID=694068 RepID=UPI0004408104|nr:uncharacterized protein FOMMEDRAFT_19284 [Fomitiporia mediterranea MF3/22]EJD03967.1 hypothetical protein FOMMEDRAFT_19284 [Fomitiporia mediterranea MF3/22]
MPKIPSGTFTDHTGEPTPAPILKRNQACHQCRRRKLKCDARRPCSTCVRSHKNTVSHAPPGAEVPPLECTFDEVQENGAQPHSAPKNRYERLENRINELEALLRQKEEEEEHPRPSISTNTSAPAILSLTGQPINSFSDSSNQEYINTLPYIQKPFSPLIPAHISPISTPPLNFATDSGSDLQNGTNQATQVLWPNWPHNLPAFPLLQHLVEVFFAFHPHAGRLFHGPTFLASLTLPSTHSNFPHTAILHAICAVGSFYTSAVDPPPLPNFAETPADDLFQSAYKRRKALPDSFGEIHAKFAAAAIDESTTVGERLFECQQATTALCWFYHTHAKWADVFLTSGRAMRYLIPLGLNMCPPFHSISKCLRAPSIIAPAKTVIDDETRRNTFWLTYATERFYSSGNGWAMSLDDQDISQLLPVRADQFEQGILVPPKDRQWAHSPDMLLTHPPEQTDSFVLYIKSSIVLSRVKNFNLRFRAKNFAGEPDMVNSLGSLLSEDYCANAQYIDPRQTSGFKKMDHLVSAFTSSFPKGFRDATQDGVVDMHLLIAHLAPSVAKILLHDPHVDLKRKGCVSAQRILEAARAILDQLYAIWATSFDLTLLDNFCCFAFFMAGRVLSRILHEAKQRGDQVQSQTVRTELEYIRIALAKIGTRIPLAYRYAKMLDDIILQTAGILDDVMLPNFQNPAFPMSPGYSTISVPNGGANGLDFLMGIGIPPEIYE